MKATWRISLESDECVSGESQVHRKAVPGECTAQTASVRPLY
jgi:hypothetical protein